MAKKLRDYLPALKYGARLVAEDMAGVIGNPVIGNVWYVDANNGNDSTNAGSSWNDAYKTLTKAYNSATNNNYDVIVVAPGGTSGTAETATLTWSKNHIIVLGASAPVGISPRARIVWTTDSVDPCLTVSGAGNSFVNVQLATFQASNDVLVNITGSRNYFSNVHFAGIGHATAGDDATARCIVLSGAQECLFDDCVIGLDTIMRSTTNATVEFASSASRNRFRNCDFIMAADNVGPNHVLFTGTSAIDRWVSFKNCSWYAFWTNNADKITEVMDLSAQTATGHVLMLGSQVMIGADDWEVSDSSRIFFEPHTATANAIGIGINPNVS